MDPNNSVMRGWATKPKREDTTRWLPTDWMTCLRDRIKTWYGMESQEGADAQNQPKRNLWSLVMNRLQYSAG
jgi:hypothetical protein